MIHEITTIDECRIDSGGTAGAVVRPEEPVHTGQTGGPPLSLCTDALHAVQSDDRPEAELARGSLLRGLNGGRVSSDARPFFGETT